MSSRDGVIVSLMVLSAIVTSSAVQAQSIPRLSNFDQQRLVRDLTRLDSQDFFKQGRDRLEQEIQLLNRKPSVLTTNPLKIDPTLRDRPPQKPNAERIVPNNLLR